jgi:hypothetical protein
LKLRATVSDADRFRRALLTAVPDIGVAAFEIVRRAGYKNLIGSLLPIALGVVTLPGKMGSGRVDSKRVFPILATKMDRRSVRRCSSENTDHQVVYQKKPSHRDSSLFA